MAWHEIHARIILVLGLCDVVKNDVRSLFQMLLEIRVVDLADHDRGSALQPDYFLQLTSSQHAVQHAFYMADSSCDSHTFAYQHVDRQIAETFVSRPRFDCDLFERSAGELNRFTHTQTTCLGFSREV